MPKPARIAERYRKFISLNIKYVTTEIDKNIKVLL